MPVRIWIYRGDFFFTESIGLIEAVRTRRFALVSEARVLLTLRSVACAAGGGRNPNSGTRWAVSHMLDALALSDNHDANDDPALGGLPLQSPVPIKNSIQPWERWELTC
jgi:hypothetical protein